MLGTEAEDNIEILVKKEKLLYNRVT